MDIKDKIKYYILRLRGEIPTRKLVEMGLKVGANFNRQNGCIIDYSHCWLISIGENVTLAPRVHILAHDASTKKILGYTKIGLVYIGSNVFIGADSIVLPNVRIGNNAIIGAGSVVTKDVPEDTVVAGNPAKVIYSLEEYTEKCRINMSSRPVFDSKWTIEGNISYNMKNEMIKMLENGVGYVE